MMHTIADLAIILGQSPELSLVVKMTIAAALGLAVVRFTRAARASVRHLVLTSTFAAVLALPVAMLIAPSIAIELPSASALSAIANNSAAPSADANVGGGVSGPAAAAINADGSAGRQRTNGNSAGVNGVMASKADSWFARAPWLAMMRAVWLAGAALMLGMFAIALIRLRAVRRTGLPWLERRDDVAQVAREAGVNRRVTVMLHERIAAPLTCGWRNPVIIFPLDAREWSDGDVRRVLLHEVEHVRRGDWMVQLAARTICAIYWFHPLVWMAWRQLCLEAERACDDAVLRSETETDYAEQLVQLAQRMSNAPAQPMVAMASRSDLSARVTALLDQRQRRGRAGIMTFVAAAGAAAVIVMIIGPLRAVAAAGTQSVGPVTADGRGAGSGAGVGRGTGAGVGRGSGAGVGSDSGGGAGASADAVIAGGAGAAVGGVSGGIAGGIAGGVVGGEPGGVAGGVSAGVAVGVPGGIAGGRPGTVIANAAGSESDDKRRSPVDRALGEALIEAANAGDIDALKQLLAAGLDVNMKIDGDGSALIVAARRGHLPAIRFLLERGADVNMGVSGDGNPLIAAASKGQLQAVTLLLEDGADIEAVVDGDENALIKAAESGHLEVVKLLVGRGANVNASVRVESMSNGQPRTEDRTPLSMARRGGHAAVVAFLQSAGATQ
jgi:beta-lactamase regulating signal transducer with metallopeptidase domain